MLAIITWWNMNTARATKINAQQNGASCPSTACNLKVMSIHFIIHQGPGPLSKPSSNVVCCTRPQNQWTRLIRSPSSVCFTTARHVHIIGSNWLRLFICLTESKEGSKNVTARTADGDPPLTSWLWSEPWRHRPPSCFLQPLSWKDGVQIVLLSALWLTVSWQQHVMCYLV